MNKANTHQQSATEAIAVSIAKTHLSGFKLIMARTVWLVLVIPSLGLTVVSFPVYYQQLLKPCFDATTCNIAGAMTEKGLQALAALGISVNGYAAFQTSSGRLSSQSGVGSACSSSGVGRMMEWLCWQPFFL